MLFYEAANEIKKTQDTRKEQDRYDSSSKNFINLLFSYIHVLPNVVNLVYCY